MATEDPQMTTSERASDAEAVPAVFRVEDEYLLAGSDGTMRHVAKDGAPPRIDGLTFGMHHVESDSIHAGELHVDGDELIVVLSGALTVELDHGDGAIEHVEVTAGHGCVVPRGVWHRLLVETPTTLLHATPGPAFDVRWA